MKVSLADSEMLMVSTLFGEMHNPWEDVWALVNVEEIGNDQRGS